MKTCFILFALLLYTACFAQPNIYTKEGRPILNRKQLIFNCLKQLNKNSSDKAALAICECQVGKIDRRFTARQYKQHTHSGVIDLEQLLQEDSLAAQDVQACFTRSGQTLLLQAESFEGDFVSNCMRSIQNASEKALDSNRVRAFCSCQLQLVKTRKLSDADMNTLRNPNSLLFYEMMYRCGDPFSSSEDRERNWSAAFASDVEGAASDTVSILTLNGMSYVKVKIGSTEQVWLLDTGASDLLINTETEDELRKEKIITEANYLGVGAYELANGTVDSCRKYRVSNVRIGRFSVDNVVIAVSEKGKRLIVGKALLNKFQSWGINNQDNKLVLSK